MEALNQGFSQCKNTEMSHTETETEKLTLVAAAWQEVGSVINFLLELFASSFFASPSRSDLVARPTILELELGFFSTGFNLASAPTHKTLEHHQQHMDMQYNRVKLLGFRTCLHSFLQGQNSLHGKLPTRFMEEMGHHQKKKKQGRLAEHPYLGVVWSQWLAFQTSATSHPGLEQPARCTTSDSRRKKLLVKQANRFLCLIATRILRLLCSEEARIRWSVDAKWTQCCSQ